MTGEICGDIWLGIKRLYNKEQNEKLWNGSISAQKPLEAKEANIGAMFFFTWILSSRGIENSQKAQTRKCSKSDRGSHYEAVRSKSPIQQRIMKRRFASLLRSDIVIFFWLVLVARVTIVSTAWRSSECKRPHSKASENTQRQTKTENATAVGPI